MSGTYTSWCGMLQRCQNPSAPKYPAYGGAGITVDPNWQTFDGFLADMGERPKGTSLDRIDGTCGYSPDNCRWATSRQQMDNLRTNTYVTFGGKSVLLSELSRQTGISKPTLLYRISKGWSDEAMVSKPKIGDRSRGPTEKVGLRFSADN